MEQVNRILSIINDQVLLTIIGVAFGIQLLYIILFFVKPKKYPKADVKHKFGIVIPARNESSVISDTIKCILNSDYPKDKFDVYVVADNCTDNTAELARAAGATVFERFDDNPKHKKAGYALKYLFEKIMEQHPDEYEVFIKFDADNHMAPDYISKMNDAFHAGVKCARGYSNSKNINQNVITGISGLWYIRDCRFSNNFRSAIGQGTMLGGAGMMFSAEIIKKHGWDCLTSSDDTEFTMRRLNEDGIKTMYVHEAVVYEDQPSTIADTFNKYRRMSGAMNKLFWTQGMKSLGLFFVRWKNKWTYFDMFLTLMFIPVCVLMCIWLPIYYGYVLIYNGVMGNWTVFWQYLSTICYSLAFAFVLAFILQALLAVCLEKKRMGVTVRQMLPTILLFPAFMIIYAAAITIGVFSKPKWRAITRNTSSTSPVAESISEQGESSETATIDQSTTTAEAAATEEVEPSYETVEPSTADDEPMVESKQTE